VQRIEKKDEIGDSYKLPAEHGRFGARIVSFRMRARASLAAQGVTDLSTLWHSIRGRKRVSRS